MLLTIPALATLLSLVDTGGERPVSAGASPTPTMDAADCTSFTATPTVSPSPTPTAPWTPFSFRLICNDTGQAASDLHVLIGRPAVNLDAISDNAPGCPEPDYTYGSPYPPAYMSVDIDWGEPCVDAGEFVYVGFVADCMTPTPGCSVPHVACFYWTLAGQPLPSESPAVNPQLCASPPVTPSPTPTPAMPTPPCPAGPAPPGGTCPPCPGWKGAAGQPIILSTCPPTVQVMWGDLDCNESIVSVDALKTLRHAASLSVQYEVPCLNAGRVMTKTLIWGDTNCDGKIDSVDALQLLRHKTGLPVELFDPCPDIGQQMTGPA
jgi:hypothetical protein